MEIMTPQNQPFEKLEYHSIIAHVLQICINGGQPAHLEKLRDGIHNSITGAARRPLSRVNSNMPRVCACGPSFNVI